MPHLKLWRRSGAKAGIWYVRGTVAGVRYCESTGTSSRPHAEAIRAKREADLLDRHTWGQARTTTFAEAASIYMSSGGEARFLSPLIERFGPSRLADIAQSDVTAWAAERFPSAQPQTLNRHVYTPLISVMRMAAEMGLGPAPRIKRPRQPKQRAVGYATDEELLKLRPACTDRLWACVLFMSLCGGARASEACRLTSADVDWARCKATLVETKTRPRTVSLHHLALEAMLPLRGADGPLFGFGSRFSLSQALARACRRVGIRKLTTHEVGRHSFAARLLAEGRTLREVQEAGGWSSYKMVAEVYGHLERSQVDEAVLSAGSNLRQLLNGTQKIVSIQRVKK